jgi:hypothetical protein
VVELPFLDSTADFADNTDKQQEEAAVIGEVKARRPIPKTAKGRQPGPVIAQPFPCNFLSLQT